VGNLQIRRERRGNEQQQEKQNGGQGEGNCDQRSHRTELNGNLQQRIGLTLNTEREKRAEEGEKNHIRNCYWEEKKGELGCKRRKSLHDSLFHSQKKCS